jgi:hypothetical protein
MTPVVKNAARTLAAAGFEAWAIRFPEKRCGKPVFAGIFTDSPGRHTDPAGLAHPVRTLLFARRSDAREFLRVREEPEKKRTDDFRYWHGATVVRVSITVLESLR